MRCDRCGASDSGELWRWRVDLRDGKLVGGSHRCPGDSPQLGHLGRALLIEPETKDDTQ